MARKSAGAFGIREFAAVATDGGQPRVKETFAFGEAGARIPRRYGASAVRCLRCCNGHNRIIRRDFAAWRAASEARLRNFDLEFCRSDQRPLDARMTNVNAKRP
jgi:hypothetical protein